MRYLLASTEDNSKKYVDIPKEMIKAQKSIKNTIKHKVRQKSSKKSSKKPIKRLDGKKQTSRALISYKRK